MINTRSDNRVTNNRFCYTSSDIRERVHFGSSNGPTGGIEDRIRERASGFASVESEDAELEKGE